MKKFQIFLEIAILTIALAVFEELAKKRTKELKEKWQQVGEDS